MNKAKSTAYHKREIREAEDLIAIENQIIEASRQKISVLHLKKGVHQSALGELVVQSERSRKGLTPELELKLKARLTN